MNERLGQIAWWARQGLLTAGAVVGVACLLVTVGAALFGLRPLVFQSGSMSPTIETGDLAISHEVDASSLHRGDIVSVPTNTGTRVTHRIVSVSHDGNDAVLRLRGDANKATDAAPYRVSHADRVLFHLPRLGYVVGWMSGPMGLFLLGLYAAFLVSVLVKKSPGSDPGQGTPGEPLSAEERVVPPSASLRAASARKGNDKGRLLASTGLSVLLAAGALAGVGAQQSFTPTLAAWTDSTPITGTTLAAGLLAPANLVCSDGNGHRTQFDWDLVAGASYIVHYGTGGGTTQAVAAGVHTFTPANKSTGTIWVVATQTFSGQVWTSADSVHFNYDDAGACSPA